MRKLRAVSWIFFFQKMQTGTWLGTVKCLLLLLLFFRWIILRLHRKRAPFCMIVRVSISISIAVPMTMRILQIVFFFIIFEGISFCECVVLCMRRSSRTDLLRAKCFSFAKRCPWSLLINSLSDGKLFRCFFFLLNCFSIYLIYSIQHSKEHRQLSNLLLLSFFSLLLIVI